MTEKYYSIALTMEGSKRCVGNAGWLIDQTEGCRLDDKPLIVGAGPNIVTYVQLYGYFHSLMKAFGDIKSKPSHDICDMKLSMDGLTPLHLPTNDNSSPVDWSVADVGGWLMGLEPETRE